MAPFGCSLMLTRAVGAAVVVLTVGGCGGDGDRGPPGPSGPPGDPGQIVVRRGEVTALEVNVVDARIDGRPVVEFWVNDQDGVPFAGLPADTLEFTIAKLVPGTEGDSDRWQSYLNTVEQPGVGPGTEPAIQAVTDSGGELTDHGDGTYTYSFGNDITTITDPVSVTFQPELTHRVALAVRSAELPVPDNAVFTWQPSSGVNSGIAGHEVVATESCNECHRGLAAHGGPRNDVRLCVTCHNPGSADANSGNTVDFRVMIHKIHRGRDLPSVVQGGEYALYGFRDVKHDFSNIGYPQDVRNCVKCHDPADPQTPQAGNFAGQPSIAACGSCHDDVSFETGGNHAGGVVVDNSECTVCHAENRIAGSVEAAHRMPASEAARRFAYNILEVMNTGPGETPSVRFSVTDATRSDAPYDVLGDPAFTGGGASLNVDLGWPTSDYTNFDPDARAVAGSPPARPATFSLLDPGMVSDNGDGTFTAVLPLTIPAGLEGSGAVAIEGHPAADFDADGDYDDQVPVTGAVEFFAVTDAEPEPRRTVVDVAKCRSCHGENDGLAFHGNNRTDEIQLCVLCHNANATDLAQRPADPDAAEDGVNAAAVDGLEERAIDFKRMIHAIHGAAPSTRPFQVYGFRNTPHDFSEVAYPAAASDCEACHVDGSQAVPLASSVLATTIDTQATVGTASPFGTSDFVPADGSAGDPRDDGNLTATAAVCSACHDTLQARAHMLDNGAGFSLEMPGTDASGTGTSGFVVLQGDVDAGTVIESCEVCHGAGRMADVNVVHGLAEAR